MTRYIYAMPGMTGRIAPQFNLTGKGVPRLVPLRS